MSSLKNQLAFLIKVSTKLNKNCPNCIILNQAETIIGRRGENKVDTSKGKEISKKHSMITRHIKYFDCYFTIDDLHSINGTFVNNRKIIRQELNHQDRVIFGGGNQYYVGDYLKNPQEPECIFMFVYPEIEVDFSQCKDFNDDFEEQNENEECCVCFSAAHRIKKLACGHFCCMNCLNKWHATCSEKLKTLTCPICRAKLPKEDIGHDSADIVHGIQIVRSIAPLCRTLGVKNVKEIQELSITKRWTLQKKEKFWDLHEKIFEFHNLRHSFHALTNCSLQTMIKCNEMEARAVIENLDGNLRNLPNSHLREAIYLTATKVMHLTE